MVKLCYGAARGWRPSQKIKRRVCVCMRMHGLPGRCVSAFVGRPFLVGLSLVGFLGVSFLVFLRYIFVSFLLLFFVLLRLQQQQSVASCADPGPHCVCSRAHWTVERVLEVLRHFRDGRPRHSECGSLCRNSFSRRSLTCSGGWMLLGNGRRSS